MTGATSEILSAFHDRELEPGATARLSDFLAGDSEAKEAMAAFARIDDAVNTSFADQLDQPISLALVRTVRSGFAARRRRAISHVALRWAGPIAAALAIVVVGHNWSMDRAARSIEVRETQIAALADQAVQDALEHALSGAAVSLSDASLASTVSITPTRTYRSESSHWCREFVEDLVIDGQNVTRFGIACRQPEGGWERVQTRQPGSVAPPVLRAL